MLKTRKRWISLLVGMMFLLTLLPAGLASAATTYSAITTVKFDPKAATADEQWLGWVMVDIDPLLSTQSEALVEAVDAEGNRLEILDFEEDNLTPAVADVEMDFVDEHTLGLTITPTQAGEELKYTFRLQVDAKDCAPGDVKVKITKLAQQLSSGEVVVATATGGAVTAEVISVPAISESGGEVTIRLTESLAGCLKEGDESVKLVLPSGFAWGDAYENIISGDADCYAYRDPNNARYLYLAVDAASSRRTIVDITAEIVVDETKAKHGDVNVTISGATSVSPTTLTVARYQDFGVDVTAEDATTIVAGQIEQEIGDIVIEELAPGTLVEGRTITLTLPANAKWAALPDVDEERVGVDEDGVTVIGTDGRTIKYRVDETSEGRTKGGVIRFEDAKVHVAVNAAGDLTVEVGGSAGAEGKVVVAEVKAPLSAKAAVSEVKIGLQNQAAADITLTENKAEALAADKDLVVELPKGIEFSSTPTVEVVSGDLEIDEKNIEADGGVLTIPIEGESTTASEIKISGILYNVDRTVPEGDVKVKIKGAAVSEVNDFDKLTEELQDLDEDTEDVIEVDLNDDGESDYRIYESKGMFPAIDTAAEVVNAKCVTPAPEEQKVTATFTVGDTKYTVGGVESTMDVAPFVEAGRTYIPVRYTAYAVGVSEDAILWDAATLTATFIKGDRVVQLTAGSNKMLVNGAIITMDVPAKVVGGRMVVPIRWVGVAFGCSVDWDPDTQTVTVTR